MYLIKQLFATLTYKPLLENIIASLFFPYVKTEWLQFEESESIQGYSFTWIKPSSLTFSNLEECISINNSRYNV